MKDSELDADGPSPADLRRWRGELARLVPILAGVVAGVLFGFRALGLWEDNGHQRVPIGGLIYLGSLFVVAGLLQLHPRLWRWAHDLNIKAWSQSFGRPPAESSAATWRGLLGGVQKRLVSREERERDSPWQRYRIGAIGIAAGATIIVSALLR